MDLKDLIKKQKEFDKKHNWTLEENNLDNILELVNKDLVGLYGEIGEFSNLIKKINLEMDGGNIDAANKLYVEYENKLSEELIDAFIYIIRIATHLDIDITSTYLKKLNYNKERFKKYEPKEKK